MSNLKIVDIPTERQTFSGVLREVARAVDKGEIPAPLRGVLVVEIECGYVDCYTIVPP